MNDQQQGSNLAPQAPSGAESASRGDTTPGAVVNSHMAIGEVLSLLQEEFPDVTISKIRFLESQGLIAPERTASGYRKFYEADIDRLRWILLQQRDNFLPLKVIKNMLDSGVSTDMGTEEPTLFSDPQRVDGATEPQPEASSPDAAQKRSAEQSSTHPAVRGFLDRSDSLAAAAVGATSSVGEQVATSESREAPASASQPSGPRAESAPRRPSNGEPGSEAPSQPVKQHTTPADVVAALQELPGAAKRTRSAQRAEPLIIPTRSQEPHQELTLEELAESTGADELLIDALVGFGLISERNLAGTRVFDPPAAEICRLAVRYQELGVEPRHLRMYKVAAEREAGFIEQSAIPLLKKRNPSARTAAKERAEELMGLGNQLEKLLLIDRLQSVLES